MLALVPHTNTTNVANIPSHGSSQANSAPTPALCVSRGHGPTSERNRQQAALHQRHAPSATERVRALLWKGPKRLSHQLVQRNRGRPSRPLRRVRSRLVRTGQRGRAGRDLPQGGKTRPRFLLDALRASDHQADRSHPRRTRPISAELYKLNAYDEGSFFKAHQDTPRSGTMFGTLVVVYPTPHTGGALILRHHGEEWTFDSAAAVASQASPAFGYIAFFSDVEHEVSVVESGHRVTLTYNLYYDDIPAADTTALHALPAPAPVSNEALLESVLRSLLEDPAFMPSGGHLGFGLRHVYPVKEEDTFDGIYGLLKGSDAVVDRVARTLSLRPRLYLVYEDEWTDDWDDGTFGRLPGSDASGKNAWNEYEVLVLIPEVPSGGSCQEGSPTSFNVECYEDLIFVRPPTAARYRPENDVHWVTPYKSVTGHTMVNAVYGNEVQLDHQYADLCLVVPIGKPGERGVPPQTEKAEISRFL
ncbi:hypothetical protein OF83DRAFT_1157604, partial [Amylostereum chailletii]